MTILALPETRSTIEYLSLALVRFWFRLVDIYIQIIPQRGLMQLFFLISGIPVEEFKIKMCINAIHYYDFHRKPSHRDNVIHNGPWGKASIAISLHMHSVNWKHFGTQFAGINTIIYMFPVWQRSTAVLLAEHLKLWLPHVSPEVTLRKLGEWKPQQMQ
jgi:hypothetical protein